MVGFDIEVVVGGDVGAGGFEVEFAGSCEGAGSEGGDGQGEVCEEHFYIVLGIFKGRKEIDCRVFDRIQL